MAARPEAELAAEGSALTVPQWRTLHVALSENETQPTVISDPQSEQIQYEVFVRRNIRWPNMPELPKEMLSVVGRALSCVVMPLYTDWVQYRKLLSEYLQKLNKFLPKFQRKADRDTHCLRTFVNRAMDRIDFLERRVTLLEEGQRAVNPALAAEAAADDPERDIGDRVVAAWARAARVRGRSSSPAPSQLSGCSTPARSPSIVPL